MAKLTALQIMNKVLDNNGLSQVTTLSNLSGINNVALNAINLVIVGVGTSDFWRPLETTGQITMVAGTQTYALPDDHMKSNRNSFNYNYNKMLKWIDSQELDNQTVSLTRTGTPIHIYEMGTSFYVDPIPAAANANEEVYYRYWKLPDKIDTATPGGTTWFPDGFDETVLVNLATAKVLAYRGMPDVQFYTQLVYGVPGQLEGTLQMMQKNFRSPTLYRTPVRIHL